MTETTPFTIGAEVSCSDGACGKVSRVVVDPVARTVTHLVVDRPAWHRPACSARPCRRHGGRDPAPLHPGGVREARSRRGDAVPARQPRRPGLGARRCSQAL